MTMFLDRNHMVDRDGTVVVFLIVSSIKSIGNQSWTPKQNIVKSKILWENSSQANMGFSDKKKGLATVHLSVCLQRFTFYTSSKLWIAQLPKLTINVPLGFPLKCFWRDLKSKMGDLIYRLFVFYIAESPAFIKLFSRCYSWDN